MKERKELGEQQLAVIGFVKHGVGNLIVNARAGSGKTTVIVNSIREVPFYEKALFVAFNRSIVKELRKDIKESSTRMVTTYHALGRRLLSLEFEKDIVINEFKYAKYVRSNANEISNGVYGVLGPGEQERYVNNTLAIIDYARYNLLQTSAEMQAIIDKYKVNVVANETVAAENALNWGQTALDEFDYTDLIWLPGELNLRNRYLMFDWIFIDEAQDSSPCEQSLFQHCLKSNGRCVMVGDTNQCINGWCGADVEAFKTLGKMEHTIEMPLSVSYRCSRKVIEAAQKIVPDIQAKKDAEEGSFGIYTGIDAPQIGDMVLCRTTEPLARLHMKYMAMGKKSYIVGRAYCESLKDRINETKEEKIGADLSGKGIIPNLYYNLIRDVKNISAAKGIDEKMALKHPSIVMEYDIIKTIEVLSSGIKTRKELIERVDEVFVNEDDERAFKNEEEAEDEANKDGNVDERLLDARKYITLSTIHKAKGLESDRVFLLCPSLLPSPLAETPEELQAEKNLEYVAITRAKKSFYYIYEKELPPSAGWNTNMSLHKEMGALEEKLVSLYGSISVKSMIDTIKTTGLTSNFCSGNGEKAIPVASRKKIKFKKFI